MAARFAAAGVQLQLPPNSNRTIGTKYVDVDPGNSLTAEIQFDSRFTNPVQMYQGGFLCAAVDEVFGPLTYMAAGRPAVTVEMSTTFIRPFVQSDGVIRIRAEVTAKTKSLIFLKAEVRTLDGKLIATATNHSMMLSDQNLKARP
jgi:uncharacterized protein (TIGR00369 family)